MPDRLVVNESPLIFLGNAARLDLLRMTGRIRVLVPDRVAAEIECADPSDPARSAFQRAEWIERCESPTVPPSVADWDLGAGESAVLATALREPHAWAVIDDLQGRKCARAHGLVVIGTVGLVLAAHRRGEVPDPRGLLLQLRDAGMWLSDRVIERALRAAGIGVREGAP